MKTYSHYFAVSLCIKAGKREVAGIIFLLVAVQKWWCNSAQTVSTSLKFLGTYLGRKIFIRQLNHSWLAAGPHSAVIMTDLIQLARKLKR